jgi:hypothetical protein
MNATTFLDEEQQLAVIVRLDGIAMEVEHGVPVAQSDALWMAQMLRLYAGEVIRGRAWRARVLELEGGQLLLIPRPLLPATIAEGALRASSEVLAGKSEVGSQRSDASALTEPVAVAGRKGVAA